MSLTGSVNILRNAMMSNVHMYLVKSLQSNSEFIIFVITFLLQLQIL